MDSLISVIVPIYNSEKYIRECLDSIVNQTYLNLEIILINDGSQDNSLNICNEYKSKDKRIILVDKQNEGVSSARNKGLEIATGDYISFVDSDDLLSISTYNTLMSYLNTEKYDIVAFGYNVMMNDSLVNDDGLYKLIEPGFYSGTDMLKYIPNHLVTSGVLWNKLFRKDILTNEKFMDVFSEDLDFLIRIFQKSDRILNIEDRLYAYRLLDESYSHSNSDGHIIKVLFGQINCFFSLLEVYKQKELYDEYYFIYINIYVKLLNIKEKINSLNNKKDFSTYKQLKNKLKPDYKILKHIEINKKARFIAINLFPSLYMFLGRLK